MASVFGAARVKPSKCFEIRLDDPFVVFNGDPHEAEPVELSGSLYLSNPDHMNVRGIKIRLEGKWKVSWYIEPAVSSLQIRDKGTIMNEEITLYPTEGGGSNITHKIAPGCHEWRFKFLMDPSIPESVEGLPGSFIVYDLKAEIERGYMSKNLMAEKHVRVIRTMGRDMTETVPLPYSNEDTWKDKVWYHIYIPTRYYIFGTSITAEFILCPLHKGVTIGKIKMEILERVQLSTEAGRFKEHSKDTVVMSHEQDMPDNSLLPERTEDTTGIPDESFHFKVTLPLERSLNKARQSVDTEHIKIFHNLKIYVNLHNPDGHVSQLLVRNLLQIFISPNLPVGDDQTIQANPSQLAQASETNENGQQEVPPSYEAHRLDQLYDDIDPSNFLSGANTPFYGISRNPSHENLANLFDSATISNTAANSASASDLQSRLAELQRQDVDEEFTSPSPRLAHRSLPASRPMSFRSSYHQHLQLPPSTNGTGYFPPVVAPNGEFDMEALARIPSYNTAVRTPMQTPPATSDGLPTYAIAISTPSSPVPQPLRAPPRAHTRGGSGSSDSGSIRTLLLSQPQQVMLSPSAAYRRSS